ncbi:MAG: hypothetical protein ACYSUV_16975 [Planctomycetota bacterium]
MSDRLFVILGTALTITWLISIALKMDFTGCWINDGFAERGWFETYYERKP